MSTAHRIRLRGPWEVAALQPADRSAARMSIPTSWRDGGWPGFSGCAIHKRWFNAPTGLEPTDQLWLVVEAVTGNAEFELNGRFLGQSDGPFRHDITGMLQARNCLLIRVRHGNDSGGITADVVLEILQVIRRGDSP